MSSVKLLLFTVLAYLATWSSAYKMVIFSPEMANSQVLFNSRVAETLAKAGHDVTMVLISAFDDKNSSDVKIMKEVTVRRVNASAGITKKEMEERQSKLIFEDISAWDPRMRENVQKMTTLLTRSCRRMLQEKEFLDWLVAEKFDLAFSHMYDVCPIGLIHYAKIPSWIWLNSGALMDFVAHYMGVPNIPSYSPPVIMEATDEMNFVERTKSLVGHVLISFLWKRMFADKETAIFRELIDPKFPDIVEVAKKCPLVMVNSNELYELPRPTLAKVVNIGGIGIQIKDVKPLSKEFQQIVDAHEGIVVFSFGSVAPAHRMPETWKRAFLEAFARFPKIGFIMRYEGTDLGDRLPPNVRISKWIPQADLLGNSKTVALISHGGYNSLQEAITAGVPLITVALFGDQPRNAKLAERHRFSINILKKDLNADSVTRALRKLTNDKSYSDRIKRLSQMAKKKPVSADHLLVSWAEFTAEFKTLDNLVPAGTKLNFIQYYSLDVIAFLFSVTFLILFVLWKLLKFIALRSYSLFFGMKKQKQH